MTGEIEKGYKPLKLVEAEITPQVRNEIKGKLIVEKLSSLSGTLEEMAIAFGNDAAVYSSSDLKLNSNAMPTVGFDPKAVGVAFSLDNGKRSKPVAGENGVVIIEMQNKTIAPSLNDYSAQKSQLEQGARNRSSFSIAEAIKENSNIVDQRYKFY
jgi:peptidyl-prolyl cis-trans isomerase D